MNIDEAFPSAYLKASQFEEGDQWFTMKDVKMEQLGSGADAETKPVVYFEETEQGLTLNVTNKNTIKDLYGPLTQNWTGKKIKLGKAYTDFQGKQTPCIRVRPEAAPSPKGATVDNSGNGGVTMAGLLAKFKELHPDTEDGLLKDMFKKRVEEDFGSGKKSLTPAEMQTLALALDAEIVFG